MIGLPALLMVGLPVLLLFGIDLFSAYSGLSAVTVLSYTLDLCVLACIFDIHVDMSIEDIYHKENCK